MTEALDVYRDWLSIQETARPLNYYQLLRLDPFDDDADRIRRHYRKLNAHVRKFASGEYAAQSQALLNELARAMLCLTDLDRKSEYDASLGHGHAGEERRRSFEELLLHRKIIDPAQMDVAKEYAKAIGFSLRDAVAQKQLAPQEPVMQAYADSLGVPFLDLSDIAMDPQLQKNISAVLARSHSIVPVLVDQGQLLLASPNPIDLQLEEDLRLRIGLPIRMVLCTVSDINRVINEHYPREAAEAELADRGEDAAEPTALGKAWDRIKKWVEENNKK